MELKYFYHLCVRMGYTKKLSEDHRLASPCLLSCLGMSSGDQEGHIFLSHPNTNYRLIFLLCIHYHILIFTKRIPEGLKYAGT